MAKGLVNEPPCIIREMSDFLRRLQRVVVVSWIGAVAGSLGVWVLAKYIEMPWWAAGGLLGALFGAFWGLAGWRWSRPATQQNDRLNVDQIETGGRRGDPFRAMWRRLRSALSTLKGWTGSLAAVMGRPFRQVVHPLRILRRGKTRVREVMTWADLRTRGRASMRLRLLPIA